MIEHRGISTPGFPAPPALTSAAEFLRVANYATSQMRSKVREGGTALRFVHTKCYRQFEFGKLSEREVVAIVLVHWRQDGDADRQSVVVSPKGKHSGDQTSRCASSRMPYIPKSRLHSIPYILCCKITCTQMVLLNPTRQRCPGRKSRHKIHPQDTIMKISYGSYSPLESGRSERTTLPGLGSHVRHIIRANASKCSYQLSRFPGHQSL